MPFVLSHSNEPAVIPPGSAADASAVDSVEWFLDGRQYLPRRPWLAFDSKGRPIFSLVLLLQRAPHPDESAVLDLIDRGRLSLDLTLGMPPDALSKSSSSASPQPVFARSVLFRLIDAAGNILAESLSSGPGARGALSAQLTPPQTHSIIAALSGERTDLRAWAEVLLDQPGSPKRISLRWSWASIYDAIARESLPVPTFGIEVIERAVLGALARKEIEVSSTSTTTNPTDPELAALLLRRLLPSASIILDRLTANGVWVYQLSERPDPQFIWTLEETITSPQTSRYQLECTLDQLLGGVLEGRDWSAYVSLFSPDGDPVRGYTPVPRRTRGSSERIDRAANLDGTISMAAVGGKLVDASTATFTSSPKLRPTVQLAGGTRQILLADSLLHWNTPEADRSLPVYSDPNAVIMVDRLSPTRYWFVPDFELVKPTLGEDPETSPFLFRFQRLGMTDTGDTALSGTVRCTLRMVMPKTVRDALPEKSIAMPIEPLDLVVELSLPFIDSTDSQPKRTTLRPRIERRGDDLLLTFDVANRWVRLAYGVLSSPGFQGTEQAKLACAFRFACYRKTPGKSINPVLGLKDGRLPVNWSATAVNPSSLAFNARSATLTSGGMNIKFAGESAVGRSGEMLAISSRPTALALTTVVHPSTATLAVKPLPLQVQSAIIEVKPILADFVYIEQSVGIQSTIDVLLPCNQFGNYYQEGLPEGWRSIGCQDALRLGQLPARLYESLPELNTSWYSIYRCLTQPSRFLLLPKTYCITRYPPEHERAYLPAAMVYAVLDPDKPENNRYRFVASLEPDVPAYAWRALRAALTHYAPAETISVDLPTDVAVSTDLPSMPLVGPIAPPQFTVAGAGVQVVLETALPDALILRTALETMGILGHLDFTLADDTHLGSDIAMDLGRIVGPWRFGPIVTESASTQVRLTNRIESAIDVSEVRLYQGAAASSPLPVGQRLERGASIDLPRDPDLVTAEAFAVYTIPPGGKKTLAESNIYIEDVEINVVFTCGINFEARGMRDLEAYARLRGSTEAKRVALQAGLPRVGEVRFTAPLSTVIDQATSSQIVEYQLVRVMTSGERVERPWMPCHGALVDIQWDFIA